MLQKLQDIMAILCRQGGDKTDHVLIKHRQMLRGTYPFDYLI